MKNIMKYSVLRYSPSKIAGEQINLGIIFDSETEAYREFRFLKKFKRLSEFDESLDLEVVKELLQSIYEDVQDTLLSKEFSFDDYIKFFINDFYFEEPKRISYESSTEVVETLYKTYFRFDLDKKERPTANDDKKLISRILCDNGKQLKKEKSILGKYHEKITYDFITDDYCIKVFDFDNKDLNRLINNAKTWAWNAENMPEKKAIMLYRFSDNVDEQKKATFDIIVKILKSSGAQVLSVDSGIQLLQQ